MADTGGGGRPGDGGQVGLGPASRNGSCAGHQDEREDKNRCRPFRESSKFRHWGDPFPGAADATAYDNEG
jgi:hypothetical protein